MTNPEDHNDRPELEGQTADPEDDNDKPELEGQTGRAKAPGAEKRETSTPDTSHSDTEHHKPSDTNQNSTETDSNKTAVSDTESAQASDEATVKPESKDVLKKESEEDNLKDVLIYSGEYGGKSTVIGGALQHLYEKDDIIVTYEVEFGEASQFEEHLIRPMIDDGEYPPNTEFPYVTCFDLSFDSRRREDAGIRFVDFPGSWLERSVDLPPNPDPESV
ncbi:MAG: hypothetical protein ABEH88_02125 [Halobacteriales archaeon]